MELEWDENKRREIVRKRGVDLARAARIFESWVWTTIDNCKDYDETRFVSVGLAGEECFVVIHTQRGNVLRLITAWKGGRSERRKYQARFAGRNPGDGRTG